MGHIRHNRRPQQYMRPQRWRSARQCWWLALFALALLLLFAGCSASAPTWESSGPQQAPALLALAVDPNQLQTLYAGSAGKGVYRSTDGGNTWAPANTGLPQGLMVESIVPDPTLPGQVYLGTDQGVFLSADNGAHWQNASQGLPTSATVNAIAINPTDSNTLYAGTAQQGVYISHDVAKTWSASNAGLPANAQVRALLAVPGTRGVHLYVGLMGAGAFLSEDGGQNWAASSTGLPAQTDGLSLLWQPSNPGGVYLGTSAGIYRSAEAGATWQAVNDGLGQPAPQVPALALNSEQPQFLYAATSAGAYRSADGGASWDQVASGLPAGQAVVALAVAGSKASLGQIYVAAGGVYRYPGGSSSLASRAATIVIAGILLVICYLLFRQQRRIMSRVTARPPAKTEATGTANQKRPGEGAWQEPDAQQNGHSAR
jgi:ligand-binding sensor domain-containing protein